MYELARSGRIYIPVWFYFNYVDVSNMNTLTSFTFQYGSTLIYRYEIYATFSTVFTFQYGSTLIK